MRSRAATRSPATTTGCSPPPALNQFRVGYSRRDLNQTSLQNGGITVPGLPANSFGSVLPIFTVAGFQQIGPTTAANSNFTTSITEFLDTFTLVRGRHTIKFGTDIRREALDVLNPPNPTGSFAFTTTGTNSPSVSGSGNALASLLLGQVNAFTIDIQKQVIQPRAHIAEFFVGDDWKVSQRLTLNIGTRYTLNFPSTEKHDQGAVFNLNTQVLDFPHTARELDCGDFGPRVGTGLSNRRQLGGSLRLRHDVLRAVRHHHAVHDSAVSVHSNRGPAIAGQRERGVRPSNGPTVQVTSAESELRTWGKAFLAWIATTARAIRSNGTSRFKRRSERTGTWRSPTWARRIRGSAYRMRTSTSSPRNTFPMGPALLTKVANPYFGQIPASSSLGGATIAQQQLLRPYPALHQRGSVPRQRGQLQLQRGRREAGKAALARIDDQRVVHVLQAHRRRVERLLADHLHRVRFSTTPARRTPTTGTWKKTFRAATFPGFSRSAGSTTSRVCGRSPGGRSPAWFACKPGMPWR